jgi:membrane protease YdiL (CAAX protease family)
MLAFIFLLMPLAFLGRIIDPGYDLWYANGTGITVLSGVLMFCLIMPFFVIKEEIIIRAFFQNRLSVYGFWIMAIGVSINFAFAHFFIPSAGLKHVVVWAISVFLGSFFLIILFEITRNLWLSMLLHLLFNCIIIFQIYLHVAAPGAETVFWIIALVLSAVAYWFAGKDFIHPFKEKIRAIPVADIIFLVIFAVLLPVLMIVL